MALSLGALLASACSASPPTGGREASGTEAGAAAASPPAGPATPDHPPARDDRFVTRADAGRTLAMRVGETRTLWVADPDTPDPAVEGNALELVAMIAIQASGDRSWEVRAVRPGSGRITVAGATPFAVTIEVEPAR